jgi:hypothetical protein
LFPNLVRLQGSAFTYNPTEWNIETVGFSIVPGSALLITDANQTTLSVQFTPVPEPMSVLGLATASGLMVAFARRRISRQAS